MRNVNFVVRTCAKDYFCKKKFRCKRYSIVIRNGKIVGKVAWIGYYLRLNLKILVPRLPQHTSNVNTECAGNSDWSKLQYSLYVSHNVTSFLEHWYTFIIYFDINLFLIYDAWCKVCNIWLWAQVQEYHYTGWSCLTLEENIVTLSVYFLM